MYFILSNLLKWMIKSKDPTNCRDLHFTHFHSTCRKNLWEDPQRFLVLFVERKDVVSIKQSKTNTYCHSCSLCKQSGLRNVAMAQFPLIFPGSIQYRCIALKVIQLSNCFLQIASEGYEKFVSTYTKVWENFNCIDELMKTSQFLKVRNYINVPAYHIGVYMCNGGRDWYGEMMPLSHLRARNNWPLLQLRAFSQIQYCN